MTERCGCVRASSGVSLPFSTSSSTSEWSRVSRVELAVAEEVGARVADVGERDLVLADERRGHRRAHAGAALVADRQLVDALVRRLDELGEALLHRAAVLGHAAAERLDRDPRRDLARLRAAHAVGDREQRRARVHGVLVRPALAAGVGGVELLDDAQHG